MLPALTWVAAIAAAFIWRQGRSSVNTFSLAKYPIGYYAGGNWSTNCVTIHADGLHSCEDAVFWDLLDSAGKLKERRVIMSCSPHRKQWNTVMGPMKNPDPHGSLWIYNPDQVKNAKPGLLILEGYPEGHDFQPLGFEISPSYAGSASNMFVINHARERSFIEQFSLSPDKPTTATWVRTISHQFFVAPNSLTLTSPTSFYVSNDHFMTRRLPFPFNEFLPITESLLALPLSWVAHVSIELDTGAVKHEFIKLGISFPNGITLSHDGSQVALATSTLAQVLFYSRNTTTNALTLRNIVRVPFSADNIRFDDDDNLIVAGHPHFPSLVNVAANKSGALSPSWVMSLSPRAPPEAGASNLVTPKNFDLKAPISASSRVSASLSHDAQTLFQSNGTGFQTSCTGLRDGRSDVLYVVGLYAEGLLVCRP